MSDRIGRFVVLSLFVVLVPQVGRAGGPLDDLRWLEGTWVRGTARGTASETWRILGDRTFEGQAHAVSKATGEGRLTEALLLVEMAGDVFYVARPVENPYPVAFRLVSHAAGVAVFENPAHDFPTRITYRRGEDGGLVAAIEGPGGDDGAPRRIEFRFERAEPRGSD